MSWILLRPSLRSMRVAPFATVTSRPAILAAAVVTRLPILQRTRNAFETAAAAFLRMQEDELAKGIFYIPSDTQDRPHDPLAFGAEAEASQIESDAPLPTHSPNRLPSERLYLVVRTSAASQEWTFPTAEHLSEDAPLHETSLRAVAAILSDAARVEIAAPAPVAALKTPAGTTFFFAGTLLPPGSPPITVGSDHAWLTRAELAEYLPAHLFLAIADALVD